MRHLVRSGKGRLHVAAQAGGVWVGVCGSRIIRPLEVGRAVSTAQLVELADACAYCRAIGHEVALSEARALESIEDAERWALRAAS